MPPDETREPLWRVALRPRMVGALVLLLLAAAVCGRLGVWQLDRAQVRGAAGEAQRVAEAVAAPAVPLTDVLEPQVTFAGGLVGRKVSVTGTYDATGQLLVGDRALDGRRGALVLTPLRVDGRGVLPVVRGWVGEPSAASPPPAGRVSVVGYLQAGESPGSGVLNGGTDAISPAELLNVWGGPIWTGYVVLASSTPAQDDALALLGPPSRTGTGLNLQNLAYAAQWWIFGGFALLVWIRMLRDERDELAQTLAPSPGASVADVPGPDLVSPPT